jgi:sec-independent protein translocase protein TatA
MAARPMHVLAMAASPMQLLVIALIILLLFGASRLGDVGKGLGEGIRNFKKGIAGDGDDDKSKADKAKPASEKRLSEGATDEGSKDKSSADKGSGSEEKPSAEEREDKA